MDRKRKLQNQGFSLIELVIVIVIMGIIGAIAIPRLTRGATGAGGAALRANLAHLRNAIELYRAEHEGALPTSSGTFSEQITKFTKIDGTDANVAVDVASGRVYGPYLRAIPGLPVGSKKGATGITQTSPGAATDGWFYNVQIGNITADLPVGETDQDGVPYGNY